MKFEHPKHYYYVSTCLHLSIFAPVVVTLLSCLDTRMTRYMCCYCQLISLHTYTGAWHVDKTIVLLLNLRRLTHLGVITEHASCFPGTTNLEQLLLLQRSCSNVSAFTRRTYPVFSSPAQRTIKRYHADTFFLDESSRPHLHTRVYTRRRESKGTLQSYRVTAVD